ncbi:MAG: hypothetical protein ACYC4L_03120 [Chloroflexota bacterium]
MTGKERLGSHVTGPTIGLFLLLLVTYAYFFPRWADWNQNSRLDLVLALVDDGTMTIDRYVANTGDYAYYQGHYYSDKAPGLALLSVPVYAAFKQLVPEPALARLRSLAAGSKGLADTMRPAGAGLAPERVEFFLALVATTFAVVVLPSVALGLIFYRMALVFDLSPRQSLAATVLFALATSAFPYANSFVGHQPSAFLLFAAFAIVFGLRERAATRRWLLAVGFLVGYAAITEYPTVLVGGVLALAAVVVLGKPVYTLFYIAAGAVPPLLALAAYDWVAFGTLWPVGYFHSALWTDVHGAGFLSLTFPKLDALWGITFGRTRGLFFLSPFLLFALPGYVAIWRRGRNRPEFWVLLLAPLSFLLFNASSAMWQGGFAVGPRYLVPSLPFLALVAGVGLAQAWRQVLLRPLVVAASIWSFVAVWAETIGGQAFPDYTANPLLDFSLPKLLAGDIARNVGMAAGLSGWASLAPLAAVAAVALALILHGERARQRGDLGAPDSSQRRKGWAS